MADAQLRTRTTSSSAEGHENGQRHIGTPQEEKTTIAAGSDTWMRTRSPKGSPCLVREGLESERHLRMTENTEGPVWFRILNQIVIFHCQLDWH